ncbi:MAG: hypothetical protein R2909_12285 [Gemmatimonadales bacterium]
MSVARVRLAWLVGLALPAIGPGSLVAQDSGRPAGRADTVSETREAAERAGRAHPTPTATDRDQPAQDRWVGRVERRCVDVGLETVVRSGEFVAGPFTGYVDLWQGGGAKLWWHPTSLPPGAALGTGPPLTVHAVRLDSAAGAVVFERPTLAQTTGGPPNSPLRKLGKTPSVLFYPSAFRLPTPGLWMLVARAGRNWGCFVFDLPGRATPGR